MGAAELVVTAPTLEEIVALLVKDRTFGLTADEEEVLLRWLGERDPDYAYLLNRPKPKRPIGGAQWFPRFED